MNQQLLFPSNVPSAFQADLINFVNYINGAFGGSGALNVYTDGSFATKHREVKDIDISIDITKEVSPFLLNFKTGLGLKLRSIKQTYNDLSVNIQERIASFNGVRCVIRGTKSNYYYPHSANKSYIRLPFTVTFESNPIQELLSSSSKKHKRNTVDICFFFLISNDSDDDKISYKSVQIKNLPFALVSLDYIIQAKQLYAMSNTRQFDKHGNDLQFLLSHCGGFIRSFICRRNDLLWFNNHRDAYESAKEILLYADNSNLRFEYSNLSDASIIKWNKKIISQYERIEQDNVMQVSDRSSGWNDDISTIYGVAEGKLFYGICSIQ